MNVKHTTAMNAQDQRTQFEILYEIEKLIDVPFSKMNLKTLEKNISKPRRGYTLNHKDEVIALRIDGTCFANCELITRFAQLETLILRYCNIKDFDFLKNLERLNKLRLSVPYLKDFAFLHKLKRLTSLDLDLRGSNISDVSFLGELKGLTFIDLRGSNISDISFLGELKGLTSLYLRGSKLQSLKQILNSPNLISIHFSETTILDFPDNLQNGNTNDIRSFYRESDKAKDKACEAKVLFVREPEVGKTSLMQKLMNPSYCVKPGIPEQSTLGIKIHMWPFDFPNDYNKKFKAHLWDFGGQQIQHYIHQFFFTEEAFYILVVDDRKDCGNLDYWFQIIQLLGKKSRVLVVRNEKNIYSVTGFDCHKYQILCTIWQFPYFRTYDNQFGKT